MFIKNENSEFTPFKECISACYELANSLLFTQNKRSWSPFGVVLALEDEAATFVNFNDNVLDSIKLLKGKNEMSNDKLSDLYKKFKEIKSAVYKRTIIYITNDDDPVRGDKTQRFAALNEAKNFEASDINFQMVTMNDNFDYKMFYNELYSVMKVPLVETIVEDEEGLLEKLSSLILVRYYQRRLNFFPFLNDQSRFIKVIQKKFIQEEKLYNNAHITTSGKSVKKISKNVGDAPKTFVLKYNNEHLEFDVEENFDLKNNDLPIGYTLIHVSDRVTEVGFVLTNSSILEIDHKEDLKFFDSFWQYCVDKKKVLVCVRKMKNLDKIRFVEFIPKFANNTRMFIIKPIPFISEIKYPPSKLDIKKEDTACDYSQEKVQVTNSLIDALTFDYHSKMFINPSFAKKKAFLRSKFLDEPVEEVEDVTLDSEGIDSRLGEVTDKFKVLFNLCEESGKKRKTASTAAKSKRKK
ncbi:hypothetical protein BDFB_004284 [Asbolus verrucosus]|uniref:Uncharacterized protein n=1 Tax=Asbolus verrucosus TaxID=1661398 RepID=A0A482VQP4_ASBVE|nr:hypothetical protein BDFB_004284 [Asbolus verrucosus]